MNHDEAPAIAALFHVVFDQKVGYVFLQYAVREQALISMPVYRYKIEWQRAIPDLDLSGVEYHSLPSGLHAVKSDLVYFIHNERFAGVSAFAQGEADSAHRNASFCAVGALVPLSYGRLGKSWLHAAELRRLASKLVDDAEDKRELELFWKKHAQDNRSKPSSPMERRESMLADLRRRRSDAREGLRVDNAVAAEHPALYMAAMLDAFGPLIFPLYRAALLRRRILLLGSPPVQRNCHVVYGLSILSSVPAAAMEVLQPSEEDVSRSHAIFSIGISDMGTLSAGTKSGWIATTTDDILGEKRDLWDVLVHLTSSEAKLKRRWPQLRTSDGKVVKATQRDLRRYRLLRRELKRIRHARHGYRDGIEDGREGEEFEQPLIDSTSQANDSSEPAETIHDEEEIVEPTSWSAVAYESLIWWASAGSTHQSLEAEEEIRLEQVLLDDLPDLHEAVEYATPSSARSEEEAALLDAQETATILTAYFRRLTTHLLDTVARIVEAADDETEAGLEEDAVSITVDDIREAGLDVWSEGDKDFLIELTSLYFGHRAVAVEGGVRLCGVRVC